jgi:hypothetical protein
LWENWDIVPEGGVVDLIDENTKEGCSLVVWIGLKLRVDLDYKCGGDCGEQTGLYS